ncbi:hypothetical protein ACFL14_01115 [Patescibacteria group bacterium]
MSLPKLLLESRQQILGGLSKIACLHPKHEFLKSGIFDDYQTCPHAEILVNTARHFLGIPKKQLIQCDGFCGWIGTGENTLGPLCGFKGTKYEAICTCVLLLEILQKFSRSLKKVMERPGWIIEKSPGKFEISLDAVKKAKDDHAELIRLGNELNNFRASWKLWLWLRKQKRFSGLEIQQILEEIEQATQEIKFFAPIRWGSKPTEPCPVAPQDYEDGIRS